MTQPNYVIEIVEILKKRPSSTTDIIVFLSKALPNEDPYMKATRIKSAVYRTARLHKIRKVSTTPVRWSINPNSMS